MIRRGHLAALAELEREGAYAAARAMYASIPHGVYFRPTDRGFTVLSLDRTSCRSMIGVGGRDTDDHVIASLPPSEAKVARALAGYEAKRGSLARGSEEERFALELVGSALERGLALPLEGAFLVHQEWRLPRRGRIDVLAIDPQEGVLVVIELKRSAREAQGRGRNGTALEQARRYARTLFELRDDAYPFFERLARVMARLHGGPEAMKTVALDRSREARVCVAWPEAGQCRVLR